MAKSRSLPQKRAPPIRLANLASKTVHRCTFIFILTLEHTAHSRTQKGLTRYKLVQFQNKTPTDIPTGPRRRLVCNDGDRDDNGRVADGWNFDVRAPGDRSDSLRSIGDAAVTSCSCGLVGMELNECSSDTYI